jgi:methyl-accepting chemotaxis protein
MSIVPKMSISARVGLMAAVFAVIGSALAAFGFRAMQHATEREHRSANYLTPQLERIGQMYLTLTRISLQSRHAMLARNPQELDDTLKDIARLSGELERLTAEFERNIQSEKERELFGRVKERRTAFLAEAQAVLDHIKAGRKDEAFAHLADKLVPARNQWLDVMEAQRQHQQKLLVDTMGEINDDGVLIKGILGALIAFFVVSGLLQFFISRSMIRSRAAQAGQRAEQVALGDLRLFAQDDSCDEFSGLIGSLQTMRDKLEGLIVGIRASVDQVATGSQQIATGNQDLSSRTEQQAASLQETAASMEQLTSTVRQSADSARQANQLAQAASSAAGKGGEAVGQVVSTMQAITESSKKIAEIIGVIDGIAFQTNILALNAAVEAARAGEQGRGFAVVAGEVRNLAQRSAQAAREIKSLISDSVQKVEDGSRQVNEAGSTMGEIVAQVKRVTDLIGEITAATGEQSAGIGQVGQAVSQLDQTTQQNAALVEQSAAAAASLKEQADRLAQAVAVFKLSRREARHAAAMV